MHLVLAILLACGAKSVPPQSFGPDAEPIAIIASGSVLTADADTARLDLRIENSAPWAVTVDSVDYQVTIGSREFRVQGFKLDRVVNNGTASIVRLDAGIPDGGAPAAITGTLFWVGPLQAQRRSTAFEMNLPITEVVQ
jgi:hypothetical protein